MTDREMTLSEALRFLSRVYTRDDDVTGFVVEWAPAPWYDTPKSEFFAAWRAVRKRLHQQTEPK